MPADTGHAVKHWATLSVLFSHKQTLQWLTDSRQMFAEPVCFTFWQKMSLYLEENVCTSASSRLSSNGNFKNGQGGILILKADDQATFHTRWTFYWKPSPLHINKVHLQISNDHTNSLGLCVLKMFLLIKDRHTCDHLLHADSLSLPQPIFLSLFTPLFIEVYRYKNDQRYTLCGVGLG